MRQDTSRVSDLDLGLATYADSVHQLIAGLAEDEMPDVEVDLLWTPDFVATTQEILDVARVDGGQTVTYGADRLGGTAVAKNIAQSADSSRVTIVVNHNVLSTAVDEQTTAHSIFVLAHELTHPLINRMRADSGVLDDVPFPSETPTELARSITRTATDEYRADRIASIILGHFASAEQDGERVRLHQGHIWAGVEDYREQLAQVLDSHSHPGWPDLVQSYRECRTSLDALWRQVVTETDQVFTLLAHAQACEDASQTGGPFAGPMMTSNPGASLYLEPAWTQVLTAVHDTSLLPSREDFAAADLAVARFGEVAIKSIWEELGLTFDEYEDRSYYIHVAQPMR